MSSQDLTVNNENKENFVIEEEKALTTAEKAQKIDKDLHDNSQEKFEFKENNLEIIQTFQGISQKILSVRIAPDENFIAMACEDGHVRVFQKEKEQCLINLFEDTPSIAPATCVRWRPFTPMSKNLIITTHTDGSLNHWHITSKKLLHTLIESGNHIYSVDFNKTGEKFATGGLDAQIRVYDENKPSNFYVLQEGAVPIHKNRVFAVKFLHDDANMLLSGGWDKTVFLWDLRMKNSVGFLYGPNICGDSLDYRDFLVLTGSWRTEKQLELWDIRKMQKVQDLLWPEFEENLENRRSSFVYTCQFDKNAGKYIAAGSSGNNEIRLFDKNQGFLCVDGKKNMENGVFSLDWSENKGIFAFAGGNGMAGVVRVGKL